MTKLHALAPPPAPLVPRRVVTPKTVCGRPVFAGVKLAAAPADVTCASCRRRL